MYYIIHDSLKKLKSIKFHKLIENRKMGIINVLST